MHTIGGAQVLGNLAGRRAEIITPEAMSFVVELHRQFEPRRVALLAERRDRQERLDAGEFPTFLPETADIRNDLSWRVSAPPGDIEDRRVEITGPVDRKMVINALNSGARVFMGDFEDATSPTWANLIDGQVNLMDAVRRTIELDSGDKQYALNPEVATLFVRPRGWHLTDRHVLVGGHAVSGSLLDFALYAFHNAAELVSRGTGPYFYIPKLENHREARLWDDVFVHCEDRLGLPVGTIRATVLIENLLAAFEMEEILFELRDHSAGLNAGRWDYIFSVIKKLRAKTDLILPDRGRITMEVPFMRAYAQQLVRTAHRRGAHAIGGMAAFIPNRRDAEVTERALEAVRADKRREAADGFDGTWVAHPDLVPVARAEFDAVLGAQPNQIARTPDPDAGSDASSLLDFSIPGGSITEAGVRQNVSVCLRYMVSWLSGTGAAAIDNLMEDAATAEISRSQIWQWLQRGAMLDDGRAVTSGWLEHVLAEETESLRTPLAESGVPMHTLDEAVGLFRMVALSDEFVEFITLPAYDRLEQGD